MGPFLNIVSAALTLSSLFMWIKNKVRKKNGNDTRRKTSKRD